MNANKPNTPRTAKSSVGRLPDSRQAVVIIHGMGEQRPMATIRAMIRGIWDYNPEVVLTNPSAPPGAENSNSNTSKPQTPMELEELRKRARWAAPSPFTGDTDDTHELMKITTAKHYRQKSSELPQEMRTDFFEFYWADILSGTQLKMIVPWLKTLVFRSPASVPPHAFAIWLAIWVSLVLGSYLMVLLGSAIVASLPGQLAVVTSPIQTFVNSYFYQVSSILIAIMFLAFLTAWYLASWFGILGEHPSHKEGIRQKISRIGQGFVAATIIVTAGIWVFMVLGGTDSDSGILASSASGVAGPMFSEFQPKLLPLSILSIFSLISLYIVIANFFVPYFGDVALYVRSTPSTIEKRKKIRQRGLALLRKLHDDPTYDRIVIVSHSLGTVIAYDLVRLLWSQYGPTSRNGGISETTAARMDALARFAQTRSADQTRWSNDDLKKYRSMQKNIFKSLQRTGKETGDRVWKISDLVTLGSPLAHAEFLVETTKEELAELLNDRIYPTSPPKKNDPFSNGEVFERYKDGYVYETNIVDKETSKVKSIWAIHHAAVFSATRWTNIYDWRSLIVFGDLVSGPVCKIFGNAIADIHVKITSYSRFLFSNSLVTHNSYWVWRDKKERPMVTSKFAKSTSIASEYGLPDHLKALHAAVDLNFDNDLVANLSRGQEGGKNSGKVLKIVFMALAFVSSVVIAAMVWAAFFDADFLNRAFNFLKQFTGLTGYL